ncbi:restriction endonuclease subunit S [Bartonella sp. M0187]|uniref:restriction endonuclease subunit S n=1 Tax=Bartonella apihabitans TaxID=2750929 RepID=UPI0018DE6A35|nr:restriction endonuclease subunit S [Bartonella apihabitans]MBI0026807.1 restriction endonuclease subunit S [Bartonella apihabitans]
MSQTILEKLLNGAEVEWKTLGEVCKFKNGFAFKSSLFKEVGDPIVRITNIDGKIVNTDDVKYFQMKDYLEDLTSYTVNKGDIIIAMSGATTGKIGLYNYEYTSYLNQRVGKFIPKQKILNNKYLYHYLQLKINDIFAIAGGGAQPNLSSNKLMEKFKIPIPPLSVQKEIVRILDAFTTHAAELTAELTAELNERKKQYNYYRDKLLTFSDDEVEWKTVEEIFTLKNGYTPSKSVKEYWTGGTVPWFRMEDLRAGGRILTESAQKVHINGVKGKLFPKDSIIMSTSATVGEHALILTDFLCNQRFTNFSVRERYKAFLDIKYVYYYFFVIDKKAQENTSISSFPSVQMDALKKWLFPIPPISVQKEIVRKLDSFSTFTTSISEGLPREIELRNKQYEYYRDQLLNFPKPENDAIKHNSTNR